MAIASAACHLKLVSIRICCMVVYVLSRYYTCIRPYFFISPTEFYYARNARVTHMLVIVSYDNSVEEMCTLRYGSQRQACTATFAIPSPALPSGGPIL